MKRTAYVADATPFDVNALWNVNNGMLDACGRANRAWLDGVTRAGAQSAAFWTGQVEKGVSALAAMGRCADPGEALEIETRYASGAMAECMAEGQRMMQLMAEIANESGLPPAFMRRATQHAQ